MEHLPEEYRFSLSKFESMLKTNSVYFFDSAEFEKIIQFYIDSGKFSRAKRAISIGLSQHPNLLSLKVLNCELMILENKIDNSFTQLQELQALDPDNEEIYYLQAQIYSKKNMHTLAIESLMKASSLSEEEDFDILAMLAMEYLFLDQFDLARKCFQKCLQIEKEDYSILYSIIYCFEMEDKFEEAIVFLKNMIDEDPYNEVAWHQLGRIYFVIKKYKNALQAFDYSILIDENFVGGYLEKAKTLEQLHSYKEAVENYKKTLVLDDPTAFVHYRIAACYEKINEVNMAIFYYGKALHEDPLLEKAWISIIDLYAKENKLKQALDTVSKAIDSNDKNSIFWQKYGVLLLQTKQLEAAVTAFKNCILLKNFNLEVWIGLSDCFIKSGAYKEAQEILLQGIKFFDVPKLQQRLNFVKEQLKT